MNDGESTAVHCLFVYGTLAPGQANHHVLGGVPGTWQPATLRGILHEEGWGADLGCPGVVPSSEGERVAGHVLISDRLVEQWGMLDAFEGDGYERVAVEVELSDGRQMPAWVYALKRD